MHKKRDCRTHELPSFDVNEAQSNTKSKLTLKLQHESKKSEVSRSLVYRKSPQHHVETKTFRLQFRVSLGNDFRILPFTEALRRWIVQFTSCREWPDPMTQLSNSNSENRIYIIFQWRFSYQCFNYPLLHSNFVILPQAKNLKSPTQFCLMMSMLFFIISKFVFTILGMDKCI